MATRTIVTSHPEVACDVCGRRLLRGEQPDVFLSAGQRRMVCELCIPRATQEGWRRDTGEGATGSRSERAQRGRSLLDRLRQSRLALPERSSRPVRAPALDGASTEREEWTDRGSAGLGGDWTDLNDDWGAPGEGRSAGDAPGEARGGELPDAGSPAPPMAVTPAGDELNAMRALEIFNAGEHPRRLAGVARSLGAPCVNVAGADREGVMAVVVAWELCWYRYEIALEDEPCVARLAAEGMELEELSPRERVANAVADERGELSLLAV